MKSFIQPIWFVIEIGAYIYIRSQIGIIMRTSETKNVIYAVQSVKVNVSYEYILIHISLVAYNFGQKTSLLLV